MALHGRTKVQLFDAKTGELTDEVVSDNIVTNAFSNVFNGALNQLVATTNDVNILDMIPSGITDVAKDIFGGVMVFSQSLDADETHIIPTADEMQAMIGCGDQTSGITGSSFTGTINTDESTSGDNYVTFVWDFSTAQCNGEIDCICLTSQKGGRIGCRFDAVDAKCESIKSLRSGIFGSMGGIASDTYQQNSFINVANSNTGKGRTLNKTTKKFYNYYRGTVTTYDVSNSLFDSGISIMDTLNKQNKTVSEGTTSETAYYADGKRTMNIDECMVAYNNGNIVIMDSSGAVSVTNKSFSDFAANWSTWQGISTTAASRIINYQDCCYKEGYLYLISGVLNNSSYTDAMRIYKINLSDETFEYGDVSVDSTMVNLITNGSSIGGKYADTTLDGKFMQINDGLYYVGKNAVNSCYSAFRVDETNVNLDTRPSFALYSSSDFPSIIKKDSDFGWLAEPYMHIQRGYDESGRLYSPVIFLPYLATINNISGSLVKDASKTMKIVYTLTKD